MSNISFTFNFGTIDGVADKIEAGDAETVLVNGVVIERAGGAVIVSDGCHADNSVMLVNRRLSAEGKRVITRSNHDLLMVGDLVIEIAPEISIFGLVSNCSTHGLIIA